MPLANRLQIPNNINAEYALINSILLDPEILYELKVKYEYFYKPELREVCKAILCLFAENKPIDLVSIAEQLRVWNKLEEIGGETFLELITKNEFNSTHSEYYLQLLIDNFSLRNIIDLGNACLETGYTPNIQADIAKDRISDLTNKLFDNENVNGTFSLSDLVSEEWTNLHFRLENPDKVGIITGFRDLDLLTGGFKGSEVFIIGGRPGMGKSAVALKLALNTAKAGHPSLFWSLEMPKQSLIQRLVSIESGVNLTKIINAKLTQTEYDLVTDALKSLNGLPIYIETDVTASIYDLMTKTRRMKQKFGIEMLFLDYIQLMTTESDNQTQEIGIISRNLKKLAMELNITSVILSQLNRNLESRTNKRPTLPDLRQSGDLEQDADKVLFIYRDEVYDPKDDNRGLAEFILAKHRNGPTGDFAVAYISENTNFVDIGRME